MPDRPERGGKGRIEVIDEVVLSLRADSESDEDVLAERCGERGGGTYAHGVIAPRRPDDNLPGSAW